jgi:hypothetical protein
MSLFNGLDLFGSGPHAFVVHGLAQRHQTHEQPGADGVRLSVMGKTGRSIEQTGTLLADAVDAMQVQLDAIDGAMTGQPAELIDHLGRSWPNVLMIEFKPAAVRRVGVRLAVDYRVSYSQVQP